MDINKLHVLTEKQKEVLDIIRKLGKCSRNEIKELIGLSSATISIVTSGIKNLLVMEKTETAKTGPGTELLSIDPDFGYYLGISVGASSISSRLINFAFKPAEILAETLPTTHEVSNLLENIRKMIDFYLEMEIMEKLLGIGFSFSLPVDFCEQRLLENVLSVHNLLGSDQLERLRSKKFVIDHDDKTLAIAEKQAGGNNYSTRPEESIIVVDIDYINNKIACGMIVDGKVYRGANNQAGKMLYMKNWPSDNFGAWLGQGIAPIVGLMNPELIVISGISNKDYDSFFPELLESLSDNSRNFRIGTTRIEKSRLDIKARAIGAAILAHNQLFGI